MSLNLDTSKISPRLASLTREIFRPREYKWWHAALLGSVANIISAPWTIDNKIYRKNRQAPFAPPEWVFGPAWLINNISVLWGNIKLLNTRGYEQQRHPLFWLQAASWGVYATFTYAYFSSKSPILAFTWTFGMYCLTIASAILTAKIDPRIALSFATLLTWLTLASAVAAYQMLYNPDPLFNTRALLK
jgi:benzodiazapine receptor